MQLVKFELYKLFKQRIIWFGFLIIIILFSFILLLGVRSGVGSSKDYPLYKTYEGKINQNVVAAKQKDLANFTNNESGILSKVEQSRLYFLSDYTQAGDQLVSYHEQLNTLKKQVNQLKGENNYVMREASYKLKKLKAIGEPEFFYTKAWINIANFTDTEGSLLLSILILISLSSIFSKEHSTGMYQYILSSKNGRKKIVTAKIVSSYLFVIIIASLFFIISLLFSLYFWGTYGFNVSLRNLPLFQDTFLTIKIWQYIGMEYVFYLFGALVFTTLIIFISSMSKNSLTAIIVGSGVLGLPLLLQNLTHAQFRWIQTLNDFSYYQIMAVWRLFSASSLSNACGYPIQEIYLVIPLFLLLSILFIFGTYVSIQKKEVV